MIYVRDPEQLKTLILKRGMPVAEFSRSIGLTYTAMYQIMKRRSVSPRTAKAIADALGVPYDDLFFICDTREQPPGKAE